MRERGTLVGPTREKTRRALRVRARRGILIPLYHTRTCMLPTMPPLTLQHEYW